MNTPWTQAELEFALDVLTEIEELPIEDCPTVRCAAYLIRSHGLSDNRHFNGGCDRRREAQNHLLHDCLELGYSRQSLDAALAELDSY